MKKENMAAAKRIFGRALRYLLVCAVAGTVITGCPATRDDEDDLQSSRITSFVINKVKGVIDQEEKTIKIMLPLDTDVTALLPEVEFVGAHIDPDPAKEETVNFSAVVKYTVYSKDGSAFPYLVTVSLIPQTEEDFPTGSVIQDIFYVSSAAEWDNVLNVIKRGGNDKNYIINVIEDFDLATVRTFNFEHVTGITVAIRGSHQIELSGSTYQYFLLIGKNQSVILRDITLKGRTDNNLAAISVRDGGKIEMRGDAMITGNNTHSYGGAVDVIGSGTTFIMRENASVSGNTARYGGGVCVDLGGTFIMRDNASVSGNTARDYGGGVYVAGNGTTFTMQDNSSVSGNKAGDKGGGVYVADSGIFTMRGENTSVLGNDASLHGGGVLVIDGGIFRIADGTVYGTNAADGLKNTATVGPAMMTFSTASTAATIEYGSFNTEGKWISRGALNSLSTTIKVVNGVKQ